VLYCVEGSITFLLPEGAIDLEPVDRLVLPPGTMHAAVVGPRGVVCIEGHRVCHGRAAGSNIRGK
jgi:hypothetical protein